ncbi:Ubiquitin carboxyl-terminal hydrolase [Only Syngen Nebraska virus 5]|uniref:Ubiquitin carboxyl-terminal hydrolase n=1 Tax=Only Syngen Nebraska virus 5 TaxID=1917232 RepID=UPI000901AD68|nr:Ubiquitin carboxyl-terminal hydrolase [Only Syngen Nebraska virus 5]APC25554.1 Ubiquitin carboxyl-terminal hydrolase [Only Syngen Nebraska virus 5]
MLLHVPQIANMLRHDMFEKMLVQKRKNAHDFSVELSQIAKVYWSKFEFDKQFDAKSLLDLFTKINRNFAGKKQYDATEAFLAMLETMETSFVTKSFSTKHPVSFDGCNIDAWKNHIDKTGDTFLSDILLGQTEQNYNGSVTYEHFTALTLCNCDSVDSGIKNYLHEDSIVRKFTRLPMILPIIFQKTASKEFIHYDTSLTVSDTVSDVNYNLFAVLVHSGTENGGHWNAFTSHSGKWFLCDDEIVTPIHNVNTIVQKDAMMLMYKRDNVTPT